MVVVVLQSLLWRLVAKTFAARGWYCPIVKVSICK